MPETPQPLREALNKALRDMGKSFAVKSRSQHPPLTVRKLATFLPFSPEPEPTPEERERWRRQAEERERVHTDRVAAHPGRMAAATSPLREVLELHAPVADGRRTVCEGCDMDGYDAEAPEWPCRTYRLIAGWPDA